MTGAGWRKSALLATLATAAACCLGSSNVHASVAAALGARPARGERARAGRPLGTGHGARGQVGSGCAEEPATGGRGPAAGERQDRADDARSRRLGPGDDGSSERDVLHESVALLPG